MASTAATRRFFVGFLRWWFSRFFCAAAACFTGADFQHGIKTAPSQKTSQKGNHPNPSKRGHRPHKYQRDQRKTNHNTYSTIRRPNVWTEKWWCHDIFLSFVAFLFLMYAWLYVKIIVLYIYPFSSHQKTRHLDHKALHFNLYSRHSVIIIVLLILVPCSRRFAI